MKINVTWERKIMGSFEMEVTERELEEIRNGDITNEMYELMHDPEIEGNPAEWELDYAVCDDEGRTIVDWA